MDWRVADKSFVCVLELTELMADAWLVRAPKKLAAAFLERQRAACAPIDDAGDLDGTA